MGKSYNLYLNSSKAINFDGTSATNPNDLTYNINWSFLPDRKKFKVTYSFSSQNITNLTPRDVTVLMAYFDNNSSYVPQSYSVSSGKFHLGLIMPSSSTVNGATANILSSSLYDHPPIMLHNRPFNSNLRIELQTLQEATATYAFEVATTSRYVLILHFEEVDEDSDDE